MNFFLKQNNKKGFSLIEVLIACAIISVSIFALMSASTKGIELSKQALRQTQVSLLLEEGVEAVKSIRDDSWANISSLTLNTNYYLTFNTGSSKWSLGTVATADIDSLFTRTIVFSAVNRDSNDDIATSGTLDPRTKKVSVVVSWPVSGGTTSTKNLDFYISDIFN